MLDVKHDVLWFASLPLLASSCNIFKKISDGYMSRLKDI